MFGTVVGVSNIIEGIIAKNWVDFVFGLLILGGGGAYATKKPKVPSITPSTETNEPVNAVADSEIAPSDPNSVYIPTGFVHRFSRLTTRAKVLSITAALLIAGVTGFALHEKANNTAKLIIASNQAQLKFIKSLTGKTPNQVNTIACTNAISSMARIAKGGSKGKTVGDGINEYNAISSSLSQISEYALPPLLIPIKNLALSSQEVATALDGNNAAQQAAGTILIASIKDFDATCTTLGFTFPAKP